MIDNLREEISKWVPLVPGSFDQEWHDNTVYGIMKVVQTYATRQADEARVDELENLKAHLKNLMYPKRIDERITELKARLDNPIEEE